MIGRNEAWKAGNGKHLQLEMQSILVDFTMETINTRKLDLQNAKVNIDQSELYNNDQLVCRLKMGGDVLNQKGGITDLMATGENFKICPSDNFNGQFHLEITPMFRSTELPMLRILIEVRQYMSHNMRFPTMWYVRPAEPQISLRICTV